MLGAALIPAVSFWVAGMENIYGGRPTYLSVFFHAVILLAALHGLNQLLRAVVPRIAFTRGELLLIYVMIGVSSGIVGDQFMAILIPSLAHPFRYASEANQWVETLLRYMPAHASVGDPTAVRNFYEGDASLYDPRNYVPWLTPGLLWAAFICTTQLMCLAVNVIIRRQWTEYEKLSFPLTILPLEMTLRGSGSIWRDRLMWLGFGIAALIGILNGLHVHFPAVPEIPVKNHWIRVSPRWRGPLASLGIAFYPFIIGLGYLLPLELTFSIWFFVLLLRGERLAFSALGFPSRSIWTSAGNARPPAILEQSIGAYIAVVYWGFATAREHLSRVWRAAVTGRPPGGGQRAMTPAEVSEYRAAFLTLGAGLFLTSWFGSTLGMPVWIAVAYLLLYLVITTAITKIRAEAGAPSHGFHFAGPDHILLAALGTERIRPGEFPAWGLLFGFNRGYTGVPQPHQLEGMKMAETLDMDDQRLDAGMVIATVLGSLAGVWALLHLCFREGVEQMGEPVRRLSPQGWNLVRNWRNQRTGPDAVGLGGIAAGFVLSSVLMTLRYHFVWFPFHPIGYAIAADWTTGLIWVPLLIAWLAKTLTMRYAGPGVYRRGVPLALGLMLGEFGAGALWSILAMLTRTPQYAFWT